MAEWGLEPQQAGSKVRFLKNDEGLVWEGGWGVGTACTLKKIPMNKRVNV